MSLFCQSRVCQSRSVSLGRSLFSLLLITIATCSLNTGLAAERDVQFTSIDFTTQIIELRNFGSTNQVLDGWRFCSHSDDDGERRYTAPAGLDGVTIEAGTSLFLHLDNNGPQDSDNLDINQMGGNFASTMDQDAYSINLYWPNGGSLSFGQSADMVDHIQWNIDGADNTQADVRGGVAETAGLWTDQDAWISTVANTLRIELTDPNGGLLHGPGDYNVINPSPADFTGDGSVNGADLDQWELSYNVDDGADANGDGLSDGQDFLIWQVASTGAPLSAATAVPEPSTFLLLMGSSSVCPLRRRQN